MDLSGLKIFLILMMISLKSYNEKSNEGYFLEIDVQYLENLHTHHNDLLFLPEMKRVDKVKKTCR